MIKFNWSADADAMDVEIDGKVIGSIQRHKDGPAKFVLWGPVFTTITLTHLQLIVRELESQKRFLPSPR